MSRPPSPIPDINTEEAAILNNLAKVFNEMIAEDPNGLARDNNKKREAFVNARTELDKELRAYFDEIREKNCYKAFPDNPFQAKQQPLPSIDDSQNFYQLNQAIKQLLDQKQRTFILQASLQQKTTQRTNDSVEPKDSLSMAIVVYEPRQKNATTQASTQQMTEREQNDKNDSPNPPPPATTAATTSTASSPSWAATCTPTIIPKLEPAAQEKGKPLDAAIEQQLNHSNGQGESLPVSMAEQQDDGTTTEQKKEVSMPQEQSKSFLANHPCFSGATGLTLALWVVYVYYCYRHQEEPILIEPEEHKDLHTRVSLIIKQNPTASLALVSVALFVLGWSGDHFLAR
jgi:hypothetical protein